MCFVKHLQKYISQKTLNFKWLIFYIENESFEEEKKSKSKNWKKNMKPKRNSLRNNNTNNNKKKISKRCIPDEPNFYHLFPISAF